MSPELQQRVEDFLNALEYCIAKHGEDGKYELRMTLLKIVDFILEAKKE